MKLNVALLLTLLALASTARGLVADDMPKTLMTTRGKLLASEDFKQTPPPFTGTPKGFASGFIGWHYNAGPGTGKSGRWEMKDGVFTGIENPEAHHPATASFGILFKDAIIQCDVRLDDVPAEGRLYRSLFVKATDTKDYVCALNVGGGGLNALAYDDASINPQTKQRDKFPPVRAAAPVKLNEWHTVVLEIRGEELVASLDDKSVTLSCPLLGAEKHSVMLGAGTQASFRNLRIWEALPNADWPKHKQSLAANSQATPVANSGKGAKARP